MKKSQLIDHIVAATGLDKHQATKALDALLTTVTESLSREDQVKLSGLGTFEMAQRKARIGRNPKTGEEITIAETIAPRFRAGQTLKSAIAKINQQ